MNAFDAFPIGPERKKVIIKNAKNIARFKSFGIFKIRRYSWKDSPLDGLERGGTFADSFNDVLPESEIPRSLRHYIETILKEKRGRAVGVEFGGVGSELFAGFTPGFFEKSVGVTLIDHKRISRKLLRLLRPLRKGEPTRTHRILEADIFDFKKTYDSLNVLLQGRKVDLIIERMAKGLEFVVDPYISAEVLRIWYSLLNEGGVMFVQIPVAFNNLLDKWVAKIHQEYGGVIEIQNKRGANDSGAFNCSAFRLRKLPGAPEKLPMLDLEEARGTPRAYYGH